MREIVSIAIGNLSCFNLCQYFNSLSDYVNIKDYNREILFDNNNSPRVVFVDNHIHYDSYHNGNTIETTLCDNILDENKKLNQPIISWYENFLFKKQINDSNICKIDDNYFENKSNDKSEQQEIIKSILLWDILSKNTYNLDKLEECIRKHIEKCDNLSGFQIFSDTISSFFMLKNNLMELLHDQYDSKVVIDFTVESDEKKHTHITNGYLSIAKMICVNNFYQRNGTISVPFSLKYVKNMLNSVKQLNSIWTLPKIHSTQYNYQENHSLNQFIYDITATSFGISNCGLVANAFHNQSTHCDDCFHDLLYSWRNYDNNFCDLFTPSHSLISYSNNNLFCQYLIAGEYKIGSFHEFSSKLAKCRWRDSVNVHIPNSCLTMADVFDGFISSNYYGVKSHNYLLPKVTPYSTNNVITFYNGSSLYNYLRNIYIDSEKYYQSLIKNIATIDQYRTNLNRDTFEDYLSSLVGVTKQYDPVKAFEDFDDD